MIAPLPHIFFLVNVGCRPLGTEVGATNAPCLGAPGSVYVHTYKGTVVGKSKYILPPGNQGQLPPGMVGCAA